MSSPASSLRLPPSTYAYDAADRLVSLTQAAGGRQRSRAFAYDGEGNLYRDGALTYALDLARPLAEVLSASDGQGQADYLYGLGRIGSFGRETRTYASDGRGSLRATTDERGRVRGTRGYDAWGATEGAQGAAGRASADLAGIFGYTGERQDPASALVFLRARWYTPDTGRFLSRDPEPGRASDPRTLASYAYAQNSPTTHVDPSGLSTAPLFDPPSFTFIADPCTGALLPVPDIADQATKALFGENRVPSLLSQLIPTLACNEQSYVKPVTSPKPASCLAPSPALQPGPVVPGLGGTVTPAFTFTSTPKAGGACGPLGGIDGALYAKAGGSTTSGSKTTPQGGGPSLSSRLADIVSRLPSDLPGLAALRRIRTELGLGRPGPGEPTLARLDVGGRSFYDISGGRVGGDLRMNAITAQHAEGAVFEQAATARMEASSATLYVDYPTGPCDACGKFGGVRSLMRQLGLEKLTVVSPGRTTVLLAY